MYLLKSKAQLRIELEDLDYLELDHSGELETETPRWNGGLDLLKGSSLLEKNPKRDGRRSSRVWASPRRS